MQEIEFIKCFPGKGIVAIWRPTLTVFAEHKVPHTDLHPEQSSGCIVGQQPQWLVTWFS